MPTKYPISNPYKGTETNPQYVRIGLIDLAYLRSKCTCLTGETDKILSTLFHDFIERLRTYESVHGKLDDAWCLDHDTFAVLLDLLQRPPVGQPPRHSSPRDVPAGASGVHQTLCNPPIQRPNTESGNTERIRRVEEGEETASRQCSTSDATVGQALKIPGLDIELFGVSD